MCEVCHYFYQKKTLNWRGNCDFVISTMFFVKSKIDDLTPSAPSKNELMVPFWWCQTFDRRQLLMDENPAIFKLKYTLISNINHYQNIILGHKIPRVNEKTLMCAWFILALGPWLHFRSHFVRVHSLRACSVVVNNLHSEPKGLGFKFGS